MKKRYPGPLPFAYDDRELFFGREEEIDYLSTLIINNKLTILHGKSGYGKSSLISAGIIPNLLENFNCEIIRIRFYNLDKNNPVKPCATVINSIRQHVSSPEYLQDMISTKHQSAWRYFKKLQFDASQRINPNNSFSELSYILVFDQFEELFTYPKEEVKEFAKELHELLLHRIPEEYQEELKENFKSKDLLETFRDQLAILDKDIPLKVLFSIRADRFNYLTHLVNYVPNLLSNTYKIKRLDTDEVREAIIRPGLVNHHFFSPRFSYDEPLVQKIIEFLSSDSEGEAGKIEVFEMQIICQKLEEIVTSYAKKHPELTSDMPILLTEEIILESDFIKDKAAPFKEIIKNYYKETILSITEPAEQLCARYLIEIKLIDQRTSNRISLDTALAKNTGICTATLTHLIDKRILRKEVNSVSGKSFELSHDSLVTPITHAAMELGDLNTELAVFFISSVSSSANNGNSNIRDIIFNILLEEKSDLDPATLDLDTGTIDILRKNPLLMEGTKTEGTPEIHRFSIKETFYHVAQQSKIKSQQSNTKNWVKKFAAITVVFLIILTYFIYDKNENIKSSNELKALVFLGYVDTVKNKEDALLLSKYIYDHQILKNKDSLIKEKFFKLLQSQDVQARKGYSVYNYKISTTNLNAEDLDFSLKGDYMVLNGDNEEEKAKGNYVILDKNGKLIQVFPKVMYAYFSNHPDVALLALFADKSSADSLYYRINKASNQFVLFNCRTLTRDTVSMGDDRYLYPKNYTTTEHANIKNDSFLFRFSANGNLIIPFYQASGSGSYRQQVRVIRKDAKVLDLPSYGSVSTSRDGTKFMTVDIANRRFNIYNDRGVLIDTIKNVSFADFTDQGSLFSITGNRFRLADSLNSKKDFNVDGKFRYAYTDDSSKSLIIDQGEQVLLLKTETDKREIINERFVDLNTAMNIVITRSNEKGANGKQIPDTLKKRFLKKAPLLSKIIDEGIQAVKYNQAADEVLVFTKSNKLMLLDKKLETKAGFQLTPNDLFGFSSDGKKIYYVRNDFVSVFNNTDKLIDFFDFEASSRWIASVNGYAETGSVTSKKNKKLLDKYKLNFKREIF